MKSVTFSQLRQHAKDFFDAVEAGETLEIFRHGKPIAILSPYTPSILRKKPTPLNLGSLSLSKIVIEDRAHD